HGANPNLRWQNRGRFAIHHALARDNGLPIVELLLDRGADPSAIDDGLSAAARAARQGRSDVLARFAERGIPIALEGVDRLVAAWRASTDVAKLLVERGSPIDVPDPKRRTPLALAVKACVDSYWTDVCTPELPEVLLRAGASVRSVQVPTGRADIDELLRRYG